MGKGSLRCRAAGFSLLEVLVAFVILSLTLTALLRIFSTGTRSISAASDYGRAVMLAQSRLATSGITGKLEFGEERGQWDERFRWHRVISEYQPWEEQQVLRTPVTSFRVTVEVEWDAGDGKRQVKLSSVRLRNKRGSGRQG